MSSKWIAIYKSNNSNKIESQNFIPQNNDIKKILNFFIVSSSYVFNLMFASLIVVGKVTSLTKTAFI